MIGIGNLIAYAVLLAVDGIKCDDENMRDMGDGAPLDFGYRPKVGRAT